ncbi:MAG TPA: DUF4340 domain-containing protein [Solimonas sp.]|nr:DUF4340 domain-containing protein [Solimonas sp.]
MKRTTLNLVLGVVVAGLAAGVFFSQKKEEKGPPLTALAAEAVTKIAVEHPGAPLIRLEKQAGQWQLTEPVKAPADPLEVNALVSLATTETRMTLEPKDVVAKELGLDPPQYSVTVNDQKIEFGGVEPINYRRYLRAGGKYLLVDDPPSAALDADYSDLVDKAPLPQGAQIEKIALPGLSIARSADGKAWNLSPDQKDASADARQKLVDGWRNARAMWLAAEPADSAGKGEPVTVTLKGGEQVHLVIAEREPQLVLVRPDLKVRYTLSKALVDEILRIPVEPKDDSAKPVEPAAAK